MSDYSASEIMQAIKRVSQLADGGNYHEAIKLAIPLMDAIAYYSGKDSLDYAGFLGMLGSLYQKAGDRNKAVVLLRQALELKQDFFGNDHVSVAKAQAHYGIVCFELAKIDEAENSLKNALTILRKQFGDRDSLVQQTAKHLILVYIMLNREDEVKIIQAWSGIQVNTTNHPGYSKKSLSAD